MSAQPVLPRWSIIAPILGWAVLASSLLQLGTGFAAVLALGLVASVLAAVHHAEVVAHRVGEPFGTFLLAVAVTVIEVALIVSLMLSGGPEASALARDTVFAAIMVILNGIIGACLLLGGSRHHEQSFGKRGVSASLATLAAVTVLTLVLPNFTTTVPGPYYSPAQLGLIAVVSLVLYGTFTVVQTVRHRDYFLPPAPKAGRVSAATEDDHAPPPSNRQSLAAGGLLILSLIAVVLLGKALAPAVEAGVTAVGAPKALVGIIIAAVVLLPEGLAAVRAARGDRLQTSLNLAIGSALASIGLTIPTVAVVALLTGWDLMLGLDNKSTVLLVLSLLVTTLSLGTGRTTVLQGVVHLVIFAVYLFTTIVP